MATGKVYLVGAGPGDPGLLTLRAKELLSQAEAVVYDALIHPQILEFISPNAIRVFRGHRTQKGALTQAQINLLLVKLAKQGKMTVRLKGGDPFVFGRGAEEIFVLQKNKVPFEVVPGVSSAIAVPAYAGIPVTHREINSSLTIVTGHEDPAKDSSSIYWRNLAENNGTLVFLMGLHTLGKVVRKLVENGRNAMTPAAVVQQGTRPGQRTIVGTLGTIFNLVKKAKLTPPAILVVGDVVSLRSKVYWLDHKPLFGTRVLLTRTRSQSSYLGSLLTAEGAEVIEIPTIEIKPLPLGKKGREFIENIDLYDWVVLASTNAVNIFIENLLSEGTNPSRLQEMKIACIGEATAKALGAFGLSAAMVPEDYKQEGLVKAFSKQDLQDVRFLIPCAKDNRELLMKFLAQKGAVVDVWPIYENVVPKGTREKLVELFKEQGGVDLLTFASSSSVDHFYQVFTARERKKWLAGIPVAVIGPVTGESAQKWGAKVAVMPKRYTLPDLVKGIEVWAKSLKKAKY